MSQPASDFVFGLVVNGGSTFTPFCRTPIDVAFGGGPLPPDDDPRFPYNPRFPHAAAFQFDVLSLRLLAPNYTDGILDETGAPIRDEYGAAIFPE